MALWMKIALGALATGICLLLLWAAARSGKPLRSLLSSGIQGLCALGLVNFSAAFTGVSLGVSWLSAGAGVLLGIPGVITLLLLKSIFQ